MSSPQEREGGDGDGAGGGEEGNGGGDVGAEVGGGAADGRGQGGRAERQGRQRAGEENLELLPVIPDLMITDGTFISIFSSKIIR